MAAARHFHPPSALSSEAADFRSANACIILLRCHPEEGESFAARTTPDEGSMHYRGLHHHHPKGPILTKRSWRRHGGKQHCRQHSFCHPEEVQAFALRKPADEGSMHLAFNPMLSF